LKISDFVGANKDRIDEVIRNIKELDRRINAFLTIIEDPEVPNGPYSGVPIAVKDNITTEGVRTTCGSKILENFVPPYDATVVKKLKKAGFVIVGKTNMDEFAMGSTTENSAFFPTRNPKDLERVPGGSSGGSAAAVASGMVPVALGSDTGGSIRQPAALTGVFGFKPTYGLVSRYGLVAYASSLDQIGPFANSTEDIAAVMDIISGKDEMDSTTADVKLDFKRFKEIDLSGKSVVIVKEMMEYEGLDEDVSKKFEEFVKTLGDLGLKIREISLPNIKYSIATYYIIAPAEVSSNLARFDGIRYGLRVSGENLKELYLKTRNAGFGEEVKRRILLGTFTLSAAYYDAYFDKAQRVRKKISEEIYEALKENEFIISPTSPITAPKIGEKTDPLSLYLMDFYTIPANLAGIPAINVPFGESNGLPVGMQIMGGRFRDVEVLSLSWRVEEAVK